MIGITIIENKNVFKHMRYQRRIQEKPEGPLFQLFIRCCGCCNNHYSVEFCMKGLLNIFVKNTSISIVPIAIMLFVIL